MLPVHAASHAAATVIEILMSALKVVEIMGLKAREESNVHYKMKSRIRSCPSSTFVIPDTISLE